MWKRTNACKFPWKVQKICRNLRIEEDKGITSQTLIFGSKFCPDKKGFTFAVFFDSFNN
jgi:hypothetical protein